MRTSEVVSLSPVLPVLVVEESSIAAPLAGALVRGGLRALEVTLRTSQALDVIRAMRDAVPAAVIGAGTVLNADDLRAAHDAGAMFAVSPGSTPELLKAANQLGLALLPGIATASEIMVGLDFGYDHFKFFPAESIGGARALKALSAPFARARFCPTGGITLQGAKDYLALPCVPCVGGSWVAPPALIAQRDWKAIEVLAAESVSALKATR